MRQYLNRQAPKGKGGKTTVGGETGEVIGRVNIELSGDLAVFFSMEVFSKAAPEIGRGVVKEENKWGN